MIRFLLVVLVLAAVIYAVFWAINRRNDGGTQAPTVKRGPVGPDDDEDFLRQLDWERRRDAHRKRQDEGGSSTDPTDPPPAPTG